MGDASRLSATHDLSMVSEKTENWPSRQWLPVLEPSLKLLIIVIYRKSISGQKQRLNA
jgi:hypothetical protein